MSVERGRAEPGAEHETSVRPVDGASPEQQILSLHSAIGNAAFSRVVSESLAARLSRKKVTSKHGGKAGHKRVGKGKGGHKRAGKGSHKRGGKAAQTSGSGMLRQGSTGPRVTSLQMDLSVFGGYPIAVDGIFGPETDGAVRAFQVDESLVADGIVGPLTSGALARRKGTI
jgi:murein L,D-transpeptidase YcbB/YkuD